MPAERTCSECGASLPANAPGHRCAKCLLALALEDFVAEQDVRPPAEPDSSGQQRDDSPKADVADSLTERPGKVIGRYKLLQQIGEGGFGMVFMAEQSEPVERKVALKVIKAGMDSREIVARFEAERQALAMMDHPNIAKVLDGGATASGRPYFVMELVRGVPITDYCDHANLSTRERLELFIKVCRAVQHAHQKGVIHRDLKPSNVLVTLHDGERVPKVIDFGVAKALGQKLTDKTLFTRFEQMIGTPAYMSPEQAALSGLDIDTRSDIYSLGVLLYELLTGVTPLDAQTLREAALDAIRRMIRETEPPKPSTRLQSLGERLADVARCRHAEPAALTRLIRGDLDWITMKALEKDRRRRYETANGLAADLERYLNHEPVVARPPSAAYRFQRAVQRHRVAFVAGSTIAVALVLAVVVSTWQAVRATRAENEQRRERVRADREADRARRAEQDTRDQLWQSYLHQAHANRWSGRAGRRFDSIAVLSNAAAIRPSAELRNEAIACMALTDLRVSSDWHLDQAAPEQRLAFSPLLDKYVVLNRLTKPITLFRLDDQMELAKAPTDLAPPVDGARFSPNGRYLAVVSQPKDGFFGAVQVWDTVENKIPFQLHPDQGITWVEFSDDGQRIAVVYSASTAARSVVVEIFDLNSDVRLQSLAGPVPAREARFDSSGAKLAVSYRDNRYVLIHDLDTPRVLRSLTNSDAIAALAWDPEGNLLATACADKNVYVWDTATGTVRDVLRGHQSEVIRLEFNHKGNFLATDSWDGTTRLWDPLGSALPVSLVGGFHGFAMDDRRLLCGFANGRYAFAAIADGAECRVLHSDTEPGKGPRGCGFSPDGLWLASAHTDGVRIWEAATGKLIARLPQGNTLSVLFHPSGLSLFTSGTDGVRRWPFAWQQVGLGRRLRIGPPHTIALERCGRASLDSPGRLLSFVSGDNIRLVDAESGDDRISPIESRAVVVALSPDGKWLADGGWSFNHSARIWDLQTAQMTRQLPEATGGSADSVSPDGKWLASCSTTECRFWAVGTWECVHVVSRGGAAAEVRVAFSHDGSMVAIPLIARGVRLLAPGSWRELADLEPPSPQYLSDLDFSPDDGYLAAAAETKQIHLWDLRSIRQQLVAMKLDWDAPPLRSPSPANAEPFTVTVLGDSNPAATAELRRHLDHASDRARLGQYAEALAEFEKAVELNPGDATAYNGLAWTYVTASTKFRSPEKALPLALKALELSRTNRSELNTLGIVQYRLGQLSNAVVSLAASARADPGGGSAHDFFFLAMAYHRLNEPTNAEEFFSKATGWMQSHSDRLSREARTELESFRAEAEDVLGKP